MERSDARTPPAHSARGLSEARPSLPVPRAAHRPNGTTAPSQPSSSCHVPARCSLPLGLRTRCQACVALLSLSSPLPLLPSPHPSLGPPAGVSSLLLFLILPLLTETRKSYKSLTDSSISCACRAHFVLRPSKSCQKDSCPLTKVSEIP